MELLSGLVKDIIMIMLLAVFFDMILPSNSMQRYLKLVMGLFIIVTLLTPILNFFKGVTNEFEVLAWRREDNFTEINSKISDIKDIKGVNQELFLVSYAERIAGQMEALLKTIDGIKEVKAEVEVEGGEEFGSIKGIKRVIVEIDCSSTDSDFYEIRPVVIVVQEGQTDNTKKTQNLFQKNIEAEAKQLLSRYFGLQQGWIKVVFVS